MDSIKLSRIIIFIIFFLFSFAAQACSDIIYLKNGRSIKGLIKSETEKSIELDLGFGTVKFSQEEIKSIDRSSAEEAALICQEWQRYRQLEAEDRQEKEHEPKEVKYSKTEEGIIVGALLNKKARAALVLDTGAFAVLLSQRLGRELGIDTTGEKGIITKVRMADGSQAAARLIVLESLDVEGVEARNVEAAILLKDEIQHDGLLGRSFLNKFDFQVDTVNKKLILKRLQPQDILEETKYFNIVCPSDWEKSADGEKLIFFGPALPEEESGFYKPYIVIEKDVDEGSVSFAKAVNEWHNRWRNSPEIRQKMSRWIEESFRQSYPQVRFVSSDFEEKQDTLVLYILYFFEKYNGRVYSVKIITKGQPAKIYNLNFFCNDKYFDEYLPVFNRCLKSFTIKK